ncbi:MAG: hypothetical protein V7K19_26295 [Nostoc sp.]
MHLIIKRTAKYAKYAKTEGVIIKCKLTENWYKWFACEISDEWTKLRELGFGCDQPNQVIAFLE